MTKKRICFIAQFPPPIHGLSKAVETLYDSPLQNEFDFERINITNNYRFPERLIKILISKADLLLYHQPVKGRESARPDYFKGNSSKAQKMCNPFAWRILPPPG